jgi:hypothetical protein
MDWKGRGPEQQGGRQGQTHPEFGIRNSEFENPLPSTQPKDEELDRTETLHWGQFCGYSWEQF